MPTWPITDSSCKHSTDNAAAVSAGADIRPRSYNSLHIYMYAQNKTLQIIQQNHTAMVCVQMHSSSKYSRSSVLYRTDGVAVQPWPVVRAIGQQNYKRHAFVWVVMLCQPGMQPYIINRPNTL